MSQQSDVDDAATNLNAQAIQIEVDLNAIRAQTAALFTIRANVAANAGSLNVAGLLTALDNCTAAVARVGP